MNKKTKRKIEDSIDLHEGMKGCYQWTRYGTWAPPRTPRDREKWNKERSMKFSFVHNKKKYEVSNKTTSSRKYVYYKLTVLVDGKRKDIRALKALV